MDDLRRSKFFDSGIVPAPSPLHQQQQKRDKQEQVDEPLQHVRSAAGKGQNADAERQHQQHDVAMLHPQDYRMVGPVAHNQHRGNRESNR